MSPLSGACRRGSRRPVLHFNFFSKRHFRDLPQMNDLVTFAGNTIYGFQAFDALWGAFCLIVVWRRLAQIRFKNEDALNDFIEPINEQVAAGDLEAVAETCQDDSRIVPQLILLAIENRDLGYAKVKQLIADRFQRDVLAD